MNILRTLAILSIGGFFLLAAFFISMPKGSGQAMAQDFNGPTGPDFVIESLTLQPPNPLTTEPVLIRVRVRNQGDAEATGFRTHLYIDPDDQPPTLDTPFTTRWGYFFTLSPGEVVEFQYDQYTFPESGCGHVIYAWADRDGQTEEGDEANNVSKIDVCVDYTEIGPDAYEPDDDCETQAQDVSTDGVPQQRNFAPEGDVDWVKFLATEGETYTITAAATGAESQPLIDVVLACGIGGLGTSSCVIYEAQTSGLHYIRLENGPSSYDPNESTYLLTVHDVDVDDKTQGVAPQITAIEPNVAPNDRQSDVLITGMSFLFPPLVELCPYQANTCRLDCTQLLNPAWETLERLVGTVPANLETGSYCLAVSNPEGGRDVLADAFTVTSSSHSTPTPTNTPTAVVQPTNTPTSATPNPSAPYEPNDSCAQAQPIQTDGRTQVHRFDRHADDDWVSFSVTEGVTVTIEARVPPESSANLVMELYDRCNILPISDAPPYSPDIRYQVVPQRDGQMYLHFLNERAGVHGAEVEYYLSLRRQDQSAQYGALVIVAGKYEEDDALQSNIHHVTNEVYQLFRRQGHPKERIYYLATDLTLDADGDGEPDVEVQLNKSNLQSALTKWAAQYVGPNQALTLFMMDHGGYDKFYLDGTRNELLSPNELDGWLNELESQTGAPVNVIIEACQAGSFIDRHEQSGTQSISKAGRVIIAATDTYAPSYASQQGAYFSDALLSALAQGMSLKAAFDEAKWSVAQRPNALAQNPWLNSDGNVTPNQPSDNTDAQRRGFAITGSFPPDEHWAPHIQQAQIRLSNKGQEQLSAQVLDDGKIRDAWVVIYPPSYQPPASSEEIVSPPSQYRLFKTHDINHGAEYYINTSNLKLNEQGQYHLILYAEDTEGLISRPKEIVLQNGWPLYLPLVMR